MERGGGIRLFSRGGGDRGPGQGPVHGDIPEGAYMSMGGFGATRGGGSGESVNESFRPEEEEEEDADMDLFDTAPAPVFRGLESSTVRSKGVRNSLTAPSAAAAFAAVDVGDTQAGSLTYGKQVEVRSGFTGQEYAYEHPSAPTVLCLSLYPEMKFYPLPDLDEAVGSELKEWMENEGKELLAALVSIYKADTFVIDLCISLATIFSSSTIIIRISAIVLSSSLIFGILKSDFKSRATLSSGLFDKFFKKLGSGDE